jgi:hypothetical protein
MGGGGGGWIRMEGREGRSIGYVIFVFYIWNVWQVKLDTLSNIKIHWLSFVPLLLATTPTHTSLPSNVRQLITHSDILI